MTHKCKFCNNLFKNEIILKTHQSSAKYCLKIQKENKEIVVLNLIKYNCEHCNKEFTTKQSLSFHIKSCKELKHKNESQALNIEHEYENLKTENINLEAFIEQLEKKEVEYKLQLEKKDDKILELEDRIERLASKAISKPTIQNTTVNNRYQSLPPLVLVDADIKDKIENYYTELDYNKGQAGVADFAVKTFLKNDDGNFMYISVDPSRKKFVFKDEDGKISNDYKAGSLTKLIAPPIIDKSKKFYDKNVKKLEGNFDALSNERKKYREISSLNIDNNLFIDRLAQITCNSISVKEADECLIYRSLKRIVNIDYDYNHNGMRIEYDDGRIFEGETSIIDMVALVDEFNARNKDVTIRPNKQSMDLGAFARLQPDHRYKFVINGSKIIFMYFDHVLIRRNFEFNGIEFLKYIQYEGNNVKVLTMSGEEFECNFV